MDKHENDNGAPIGKTNINVVLSGNAEVVQSGLPRQTNMKRYEREIMT
jgi:hypothetical protein